ncbi:MAG TPA: glutamine amidotransferase [Candidatus Saccharimonadales bacterium]|nr:glutamine amidotransferase [Candidatus Saccharimonadales bacterium]
MNFQFSQPYFLLLLPLALGWVIWLAWKTDVQIGPWRRWVALGLRILVVCALILALAGLQWKRPMEGMNVFFLLDRSDSIPSPQQEAARRFVNKAAAEKQRNDQAGILVFGSEAALESAADSKLDLNNTKVLAVVGTERTDLAGAIRLGAAAFPETGQKRLVLLSDGNENMGDAIAALSATRRLGVSLDVVPLGIERGNDVSVLKLGLPYRVKKGQTFEAKIYIHADHPQKGTVRLYRNDAPLGEQQVDLAAGKNLFAFPQTLTEPGFYSYTAVVEAAGDNVPQNNRATGFTSVRGDPRVLVVSYEPAQDTEFVNALRSARLEVKAAGLNGFPGTLAEMQSYDSIFISNLAAGDIGQDAMKLLESAVRDFGVGLVCIGGDQTYAAGGYRGTPLEEVLPVNMELDSKKVLPSGAVALVMHGMEFMNGNQVARDCGIGVLDALGPQDEMGVVLWDGTDHWLFPMTKVGPNRAMLGQKIAGMNQGDLPGFQSVMSLAHQGLKKSPSNLKHMIVFSDGDPVAPSQQLMQDIVKDKVTVSTVLIAGHAGPDTMISIAEQGRGRFYNVQNAGQLPQIFIKEAAVILKSAIFEEPFTPRIESSSEIIRGIGKFPRLRGYVCTTKKARAETPLVSDKNDPVLAHWQFGLGRAVAFTSDAKARWAKDWLGWEQYKQFWSQIAQWSLRRLENADFTTDVSIDKGDGHISVEAVDENGDYRNFLSLQTVLVSPKGEQQTLRLEQTGPGHYEANFPTREVGSYLLNLLDMKDGKVRGSQVVGTSVNYSPEFNAPEPNLNLLNRLATLGQGRILDPSNPADNPFRHDRLKTFQPKDLWEWLLRCAIVLFTLDVGVRRIQLDREEILKGLAWVRGRLLFWETKPRAAQSDESLAALLNRRDKVRSAQPQAAVQPDPDLFRPKTAVILPQAAEEPSEDSKKPEPKRADQESPQTPVATTSRLLEAKRRAQRKKGPE